MLTKNITRCLTLIFVLALGINSVQANPIGDFFKRVGRTITKPPAPKETPKRMTSRSTKRPSPTPSPSAETERTEVAAAPSPPVETPTPVPPPEQRAVPQPRSGVSPHADAPYGVPVPGRPGFVTSPYAPTRGYVDVRGFPPGTEVKDPYSGKVFLTP